MAIKNPETGEYELQAKDQADLSRIFTKYVEGMEREPKKRIKYKHDDNGIEQYLLNEYPTPEWKLATVNPIVKSKQDEKISSVDKKRARSSYDDGDGDGDDDDDNSSNSNQENNPDEEPQMSTSIVTLSLN